MEYGAGTQGADWNHADVADVLIAGGGPAGLTAALYASRARLSTVLLESGVYGGQAAITDKIENYPGFPDGIAGGDLAAQMERQTRKFGAFLASDAAQSVVNEGGLFIVRGYGGEYRARSLIIATGAEYRKTGIKGEAEFLGRGVSFCATCDAAFFKGRGVAVVGGGDSAVKEALFLTKFASVVHVVHRRDRLRAEKVIQEEAFANPKIKFAWDTVPVEVKGEGGVSALKVRNVKTMAESEIPVEGIFVFIGTMPRSELVAGLVETDESGYIRTDERMATSLAGVFAAGDVRVKSLRQVSTAVGDGAIAAHSAEEYIEKQLKM
jgi:thioredoxin reductase (NADPH)